MKYNTHTFDNGLRLIHLPSASPILYCGYQIAVGTRHEKAGEEGLAHFCEHCTFKGTERRNALDIINELESVGGELNAFTNKEATVYYAAILKEYADRAVDLLTDMVFNSQYPQTELDKEKEVVCDEIESYNDSPAELIYDEFDNLIFSGHPLGHNILGNAGQVRGYTTDDALRFTRQYYQPSNAIFFAYGDADFGHLVSSLEQKAALMERSAEEGGDTARAQSTQSDGEERNGSEARPGSVIIRDKGTHQAHVMTGCRAYSVHDGRRMALYLLNNILGGPGLNARLNLSLRERNGLVYTVESTMVNYGDTGIWSIYFGCDPKDTEQCLSLVREELDHFIATPLTDDELTAAKRQIKGQIALACDNREQFALDFGKSFLHYGWERDIDTLYQRIDNVTAADIQAVASDLFPAKKKTTLIYR